MFERYAQPKMLDNPFVVAILSRMEESVILFRRYRRVLPALCSLLLSTCAPPLMESARIHKGFAWGGGLGLCWIVDNGYMYSHGEQSAVYPGSVLFYRYGFSERFSLGLQGSITSNTDYYNIHLNTKWKLGKYNACLLSTGIRWLWEADALLRYIEAVNFSLLQDMGDMVTVKFGGRVGLFGWSGYGFAYGSIEGAFDVHPNLSKRLRLHITGGWALCGGAGGGGGDGGGASFETATVGIGIEFLPSFK